MIEEYGETENRPEYMYGLCGVEVGGGQVEFLGGYPAVKHRIIIGNIAEPLGNRYRIWSDDPLES